MRDYTIHNYPPNGKEDQFWQLVSLHARVLDDVCACPKMRWLETLFQAKFESIAKLKRS
jgi:hypothetical protein